MASIIEAARPIGPDELRKRRSQLSKQLEHDGVDVWIAEPGSSSAYFANFSSSDAFQGPVWWLSERPFLLATLSAKHVAEATADNATVLLVPSFEEERARKEISLCATAQLVTWDESQDPYSVLVDHLAKFIPSSEIAVAIDQDARYFIATGLSASSSKIRVMPASSSIVSLRMMKSDAEIDLLRRVGHATLSLVRSVQPCLKPLRDTEMSVTLAVQALFARLGLPPSDLPIVLFGDNAALPHGGGDASRVLQTNEFVLMDISTSLYGYFSDVTRTVLPPGQNVSDEAWKVWFTVFNAQTAALQELSLHTNSTIYPADLDDSARDLIASAGYGEYFTHRLGHGIGLEIHEKPYLNSANRDLAIEDRNTFTLEPGVYILSKMGVRIEDVALATEWGYELLAGSRAISPYRP